MREEAIAFSKTLIEDDPIPERIYLGSSWKPKDRLTEEQAKELLVSGCSPAEISEVYAGFTKMQLAAFKAHQTMGTYSKD